MGHNFEEYNYSIFHCLGNRSGFYTKFNIKLENQLQKGWSFHFEIWMYAYGRCWRRIDTGTGELHMANDSFRRLED